MPSKTYKAVKEKVTQAPMAVADAVAFVKNNARAKFDETVDLHIRLGVNAGKSSLMVRGSVQLPHGTPKKKKIAVFTSDKAKQKAAQAAGASLAGGEELISQVEKDGGVEADIVIASPEMMPKIAKVAKILGPKGLMPNPKNGTVTADVDKAVTELSGGKVAFKMDKQGNIHESVGKVSWEAEKIAANAESLLEAVAASRPVGQKGEFIRSVAMTASMGPAVRVSSK